VSSVAGPLPFFISFQSKRGDKIPTEMVLPSEKMATASSLWVADLRKNSFSISIGFGKNWKCGFYLDFSKKIIYYIYYVVKLFREKIKQNSL